jgi:hypothetical protein
VNAVALGGIGGLSQISPEAALYTALMLGGNRAALRAAASRGVVHGETPFMRLMQQLTAPAPRALPAAGLALPGTAAAEEPLEIDIYDDGRSLR